MACHYWNLYCHLCFLKWNVHSLLFFLVGPLALDLFNCTVSKAFWLIQFCDWVSSALICSLWLHYPIFVNSNETPMFKNMVLFPSLWIQSLCRELIKCCLACKRHFRIEDIRGLSMVSFWNWGKRPSLVLSLSVPCSASWVISSSSFTLNSMTYWCLANIYIQLKGKYFLSVSELVIITALTTFAFISLSFFSSLKHFQVYLKLCLPNCNSWLQIKHLVVSKKVIPKVLSPLWALCCISLYTVDPLSSIFHRQLNLIVFQSEIILSSLIFYLQIRSSVYSSFG